MTLRRTLATCLALLFSVSSIATAQESQIPSSAPEVISTSLPSYPPIARVANVIGTVNVDVTVAEDGTVAFAKAIDGHPLLRSVSEAAALKWAFAPSKGNVEPRVVRLTFTFRLLAEGAVESELKPIFLTPYHVEIRQMPSVPISDPPAILGRKKKRKSKAHQHRPRQTESL